MIARIQMQRAAGLRWSMITTSSKHTALESSQHLWSYFLRAHCQLSVGHRNNAFGVWTTDSRSFHEGAVGRPRICTEVHRMVRAIHRFPLHQSVKERLISVSTVVLLSVPMSATLSYPATVWLSRELDGHSLSLSVHRLSKPFRKPCPTPRP